MGPSAKDVILMNGSPVTGDYDDEFEDDDQPWQTMVKKKLKVPPKKGGTKNQSKISSNLFKKGSKSGPLSKRKRKEDSDIEVISLDSDDESRKSKKRKMGPKSRTR